MAYVHCHTRGCNWQQDDFWSWGGYNPLRWFFKYDIPWLWKPRFVVTDPEDIIESKFARKLGLIRQVQKPWIDESGEKYESGEKCCAPDEKGTTLHPPTYTEYQQHTWYMLLWSLRKWLRRVLRTQKWWTYKAWRKAVKAGHGGCPKCGEPLCID